MIAALRFERVKVLRHRVLVVTALAVAVFAIGSAAIVLSSARASGSPAGAGATVATLSESDGGAEAFTTAVSFAGTFACVVFAGLVAVESSRGTFRTMLLQQPRRLRLLAGKIAALIGFAAAVLAVAEILTWLAARLIARSQDVGREKPWNPKRRCTSNNGC
jgi:ABC-2 type transport system permease protein